MANGTGAVHCLTTFLGPDAIHFMPTAEFSRDIDGVTLQDGLINLLCPNFNLKTPVKMDYLTIAKISSKIIRLATPSPSILDHLFNQLYPKYSKEPHNALDHIQQTYDYTNVIRIFSMVFNYYTQILTASCPLIDQEVLPVSICQAFMDVLNSCLLADFHIHFLD